MNVEKVKDKVKMTRKQAIKKAISALSGVSGSGEAIRLLQDLYDEMPLIHWTDKSIRDAVEQFKLDNKRLPTSSDFRKKGMPPHPVIENTYKMPLAEWLELNYPTYKPTRDDLKKKYTKRFVAAYKALKPETSKIYSNNRPADAPCWQTVANYYGVKSWQGLLKALSLPVYQPKVKRVKECFNVKIINDLDEEL